MENAPLQPARFWASDIRVHANSEYQPSIGTITIPQVKMSATIEEGISQPLGQTMYQCQLDIETTDPPEDIRAPYAVGITVFGQFAPVNEVQIEHAQLRRMVAFNGLSTLYGFARDVLIQFTGVSTHGPFILPMLSITDIAEGLLSQTEIQEQALPAEQSEIDDTPGAP